MADLNEQENYESAIYQIATDDPVIGGPPSFDNDGNPTDGISNVQAFQLANRTAFLKAAIDNLGAFKKTTPDTYEDDLNNLTENGFYTVANSASNTPPGQGGFLCIVSQNPDKNRFLQIAYNINEAKNYFRLYDGTDWSSWKAVAYQSDLGTAADKNVGTNNDEVPQNSDLGSAAYEEDSKYLPASVLRGSVSAFATDTPPSGYLACNGAAVSRTTYSELFNLIGTTFGNGDGSTTFNLPDLRGEFIRGFDDGRGADPEFGGRDFGSFQDFMMEQHKHLSAAIFETTANFVHSTYDFDLRGGTGEPFISGGGSSNDRHSPYTSDAKQMQSDDATFGANQGDETRPRNVALLYCIKY